jgi:hypothetical protein
MDFDSLRRLSPDDVRKYGRRALTIGFEPIPATLYAVRFNGRTSGSIGVLYGIESGTVADPRVDRSAALTELSHNFEHVAHAVWLVEDDRTDWGVAWGRDDGTS